jgi:sec-independent protein translocase protein TatB
MFVDLSWSHILLFLVVALVVVGPQDLPKLMRKIGQWVAKARNLADQFRTSFDEMARQSELDELRKEIEALRNVKPLAETEKAFNEALRVPEVSLDRAEPAPPPKPQVPPAPELGGKLGAESAAAPSPHVPPAPLAPELGQAELGGKLGAESAAAPSPQVPPAPPTQADEPELPFAGGFTPPQP